MDQVREYLGVALALAHNTTPVIGSTVGMLGLLLLLRGGGLVRGFLGMASGLVLGPLAAGWLDWSAGQWEAMALGGLAGMLAGAMLPILARAATGAAIVAIFLPAMTGTTGGSPAGEAVALLFGACIGAYLTVWVEVVLACMTGVLALAFCGEVFLPEFQPLTAILSLSLGVLPPGPKLSPSRLGTLILLGSFVLGVQVQRRRVRHQLAS